MDLQKRIEALCELGTYMAGDDPRWTETKTKAYWHNPWFTPEFIHLAVTNIVHAFLRKEKLQAWISAYHFPERPDSPKNIGLVMAGNVPLVGFHDFLSVFISGHSQTIKPSSKDNLLIAHLAGHLKAQYPETTGLIRFADMLKGCDAYIATGSNNSSRYFEYYFGKYPHLIRRNRSSLAILTGDESRPELERLSDDVYTYFGLGCRNVTKLLVPRGYDFVPLLQAFMKYDRLAVHNKYKNNYDYQLALLILNKRAYMTNDTILLIEEKSLFSPISVLHYSFYEPGKPLPEPEAAADIQCIEGQTGVPFGTSQQPSLQDYADGADTLQFLRGL
jgi:hypothetical protein